MTPKEQEVEWRSRSDVVELRSFYVAVQNENTIFNVEDDFERNRWR